MNSQTFAGKPIPRVIVTGGGGYVGRHILRHLKERALSIDHGSPLEKDLREKHAEYQGSYETFRSIGNRVVIHCASLIQVGESMECPQLYWKKNFCSMVDFFYGQSPSWTVFSSSAAVYKPNAKKYIKKLQEDSELGPISPYGEAKLACERFLLESFPDKVTIFRYFNAAGSDEWHEEETHFIPNLIDAALFSRPLKIHGDGSQIRDFVHPDDLAEAHVKAIGTPGIFNLGSGVGYSLMEVIDRFQKLTRLRPKLEFGPPRPGDPRVLVADISKAEQVLGWKPKRDLDDILLSSYNYLRRFSAARNKRCNGHV